MFCHSFRKRLCIQLSKRCWHFPAGLDPAVRGLSAGVYGMSDQDAMGEHGSVTALGISSFDHFPAPSFVHPGDDDGQEL